jgi:hypothetical protein
MITLFQGTFADLVTGLEVSCGELWLRVVDLSPADAALEVQLRNGWDRVKAEHRNCPLVLSVWPTACREFVERFHRQIEEGLGVEIRAASGNGYTY